MSGNLVRRVGDVRGRITALVPVLSSLSARLAQLGILATVSRSHVHGVSTIISAFGLVSAFAIITDSGFSNYVLSTHSRTVPAEAYFRGIKYHGLLAIVGAFAASASALIVGRGELSPLVIMVTFAFAVSQAGDSLARTARAPYLSLGRPARFAAAEIATTVLKLPLIVLAEIEHSPRWFLGLPVVSIVVAAASIYVSRGDLTDRRHYAPIGIRDLWPYTASNSVSALYSQAPVVVAGFFLGPARLASLTLVYRTIQPTELLPATFSQQLIPTLRQVTLASARRYWFGFLVAGALMWGVVTAASPLVESVYDLHYSILVPLSLAGAGLPLKYGNYSLVATLVARGAVKKRLRSSLAAGFAALVLVGIAAEYEGVNEVLLGVVAAEFLLTCLLWRALRRHD